VSDKTFYITTPLYYVNGAPHIGHAYSTVGADALARYARACGRQVYFLTGTDEHGQKVAKAAEEKGFESPQALADAMVLQFKKAWEVLGISYDRFIRTTDADHIAAAQEFFRRVEKNGFLEKRPYEGWYCIYEETFWLEKDLKEPGNLCPDCGRPTQRMEEQNYFFLQSALAERLRAYLGEHPGFIQPETRRNEVLGSYLEAKDGVTDVSITRSSVKWGIPVPGDDRQVLYVWFDALINYLTATGWPKPGFEKLWPADVHIIGKEILRFHAVLWPSMLMAAGIEPPSKVFGTGWIVNDGKKMSKSLGNEIDPLDWAARFGPEVLRYYILREIPFGMDGSVSEEGIQKRYNSELANDLGNLLNRSLTMLDKYCEGRVPSRPGDAFQSDPLRQDLAGFWGDYAAAMDSLAFHQALDAIFARVRSANQYIDSQAPWKKAKLEGGRPELENCLYNLAEALRIAAYAMSPFMPQAAAGMLAQLGLPATSLDTRGELQGTTLAAACQWGLFEGGHATAKGEPLFPRAEAVPA
jgi:methionyl-tRNA synthetase